MYILSINRLDIYLIIQINERFMKEFYRQNEETWADQIKIFNNKPRVKFIKVSDNEKNETHQSFTNLKTNKSNYQRKAVTPNKTKRTRTSFNLINNADLFTMTDRDKHKYKSNSNERSS